MSDRVEALFHQAADLPPAKRRALLDDACQGDVELRGEVERLLAEDSRLCIEDPDCGFLESPLVRSSEPRDGAEAADRGPHGPRPVGLHDPSSRPPVDSLHIPHYRIVRVLGEGGMGAVYQAEQDCPRRPVALKVIRPGLTSPAILKRFQFEAQILGRLRHPGIAQVFEAGLANDGQPFFAMEFIRGLPLDEYANRHALDSAARIALLVRVCDAVQHAHDQGVIHRDLKPANILVEETGLPKVLDFGVARATDPELATTAGLTRTGQFLGTPNYMSPEQVSAAPGAVDHRTDVFALGVILFELLAHRLPHRLDDRPLVEAARVILHEDPPRLGSIAPGLRGDVETIVAKAMEKVPARRYATAADLAADLQRWLNHQPIQARPPSALYQIQKFTRRNKTLVGGVAATGLALVLGLIGTILFAIGEARQRELAERNALAALDEKREAMFQSYRARLAAAASALSAQDVADAARHLGAAPEELRDWEWRHLRAMLDESTSVIPLPAGGSGFLASGSDWFGIGLVKKDGLRILNLEGGESLNVPIRARDPRTVFVSKTRLGFRVAGSVQVGAMDLFDEAGRLVSRAGPADSQEPRAALSTDGARLATTFRQGGWVRLAVYDSGTGRRTAVCDGHRDNIWSFAFSPDGARLASAGEDRAARLWDTETGKLLVSCEGHENKVLGVSFSPDGARLLTTSADGTARQWDVATGREIEPAYDRHSGLVVAASYSPDGRQVASAGSDRTVRVWRASGRRDSGVLLGHTGIVSDVAFAPDGRRIVSLSRTSMLNIAGDDTIRVWDVAARTTLPVLRGHTGDVYPTTFSRDGLWIASGGWDKTVRLWDAITGEPCAILPHPDVVHDLAYGPDGTWLATASLADSRIRIWDAATARLRKEITLPPGRLRSVKVRPDGRRIAATSTPLNGEQATLYVCDVDSGAVLFSMESVGLSYSPDGCWLAVRGADLHSVVLLDADTHAAGARLVGHEAPVVSASFSRDGRRLASCSRDRTVRVWQVDGGECLVLRGHSDEVFAAAFHPDGARLASAGRDRDVWLWDLPRGEEVARLQGHTSYIWSLAFSPDGTMLASGSGDATVRLWDAVPLRIRDQARREAEDLRPEAERLVDRLSTRKTLTEVVATLKQDAVLSQSLRQASLRVVLRRAQSADE